MPLSSSGGDVEDVEMDSYDTPLPRHLTLPSLTPPSPCLTFISGFIPAQILYGERWAYSRPVVTETLTFSKQKP